MNTKRGFTMMELLVVMGILAVLVVVMTEMLHSVLAMRLQSEAMSAVDADMRYTTSRLQYDLARASAINLPTVGASGSTLELTIDGITYVYTVEAGKLYLTVGTGVPEVIHGSGSMVTQATFTRLNDMGGKQSVAVTLAMQAITQLEGGRVEARRVVTAGATR